MSEGERVSIRAHFERFPASIKGAIVLRGADRDPHQVTILSAWVAEVSGTDARPIGISSLILNVAPRRDLFVPFEFPVTELGPGWYGVECEITVDGTPAMVRPGRRFSVPWPRGSMRRGVLPVGKAVGIAGGPKVSLEQVDCAADCVRLSFSSEEPADVRILADGERLSTIEEGFDPGTGKGSLTAYPLPKTASTLRIEVRASGKPRGEPASVEVPLP